MQEAESGVKYGFKKSSTLIESSPTQPPTLTIVDKDGAENIGKNSLIQISSKFTRSANHTTGFVGGESRQKN